MTKIMLTGHGDLPLPEERYVPTLSRVLERFHDPLAIAGGCVGADTIWARAAAMKQVPFEIYVPVGYEGVFIKGEEALKTFNRMLECAAREVRIGGGTRYAKGNNAVRNHRMVDDADVCVALSKLHPKEVTLRNKGGTNECIRYIMGRERFSLVWIPADDPEHPIFMTKGGG